MVEEHTEKWGEREGRCEERRETDRARGGQKICSAAGRPEHPPGLHRQSKKCPASVFSQQMVTEAQEEDEILRRQSRASSRRDCKM